jgi:hypothetical protein
MKTTSYNPSSLEVEIATVIENLKDQISSNLQNRKVLSIDHKLDMDNPQLDLTIQDLDGDIHKIILKLIQKPDEYI